jgi:prolyl oligopeptidase
MSEAGYPITVHEWKRGTPLDSAKEVFHGDTKDNGYGDNPFVLVDGRGNRAVIIVRNRTTFSREQYLLVNSDFRKLSLPPKSSIEGQLDGQLLVTLDEDWTPEGQVHSFAQGSVLAVPLMAAERDPRT